MLGQQTRPDVKRKGSEIGKGASERQHLSGPLMPGGKADTNLSPRFDIALRCGFSRVDRAGKGRDCNISSGNALVTQAPAPT